MRILNITGFDTTVELEDQDLVILTVALESADIPRLDMLSPYGAGLAAAGAMASAFEACRLASWIISEKATLAEAQNFSLEARRAQEPWRNKQTAAEAEDVSATERWQALGERVAALPPELQVRGVKGIEAIVALVEGTMAGQARHDALRAVMTAAVGPAE